LQSTRKWMAQLMLRTPAPVRSLRGMPVLGDLIHNVSHRLIHADEKVWVQIEEGYSRPLKYSIESLDENHFFAYFPERL
jgi:hypothetical protein